MKSQSCKFKRFCSANICKWYSELQYKISFEFLLWLLCLNFSSRLCFLKKIKITCINNSILQNGRILFYKPGIRSINICKLIVWHCFMKGRVQGQCKIYNLAVSLENAAEDMYMVHIFLMYRQYRVMKTLSTEIKSWFKISYSILVSSGSVIRQ